MIKKIKKAFFVILLSIGVLYILRVLIVPTVGGILLITEKKEVINGEGPKIPKRYNLQEKLSNESETYTAFSYLYGHATAPTTGEVYICNKKNKCKMIYKDIEKVDVIVMNWENNDEIIINGVLINIHKETYKKGAIIESIIEFK